jgi:hypothetical protein
MGTLVKNAKLLAVKEEKSFTDRGQKASCLLPHERGNGQRLLDYPKNLFLNPTRPRRPGVRSRSDGGAGTGL